MHSEKNAEEPEMFDPDQIIDEESHKEMMAKMAKKNFERALKNQPYLDHVFGLVREAAQRNII